MPRKTQRVQAIVLDRTRLGEQDLICRLLAQDGTRLDVVAKGGRKPGSQVAARVDLFCESDLLVTQGRGSLAVIAESAIVHPHARLRGDYERTCAAGALAQVARHTSYEDAQDAYLYPILSRALTACEQATAVDASALDARLSLLVAAYVFKVLAHEGWLPVLDACVGCGEPNPSRFSAAAGGALCESCAAELPGAEPAPRVQLDWISYLLGATFDRLLEVDVDARTAMWLARMAHLWATTHLDVRLKAFEFFLGV